MFYYQMLMAVQLCFTVAAAPEPIETHAKVVGGYPVGIDVVPFQVSIRLRYYEELEFGSGHMCSGSVISQRVVCSAAHCFAENDTYPAQYRDPENYVVVAGSSHIQSLNRFSEVYLVQEIIGHERYHPYTLENDIALVFLNSFIPYHHFIIRSLPLASAAFPPGTFCSISGWGNVYRELHQAIVPIQDQRLCSFIYISLPKSQICAGYLSGGVDACKGDSGGPMVCNGHLTGIISWGVDCGKVFFPGVYTNISYFLNWITKVNSSLDYEKYLRMRGLNGVGPLMLPTIELYVICSVLLMAMIKTIY
ncbi:trypsin [Drosophila innubila]|uniref:trypsin n=1 Tax=Drosophila innubila TaxID=198719 RepID=UPI00148DAE69|nr:trypsin [Drosophila innubila]